MDNIHIALACDDNYAQHLGVALVSIIENKTADRKIFFHILENGLSQKNKEKIAFVINGSGCQSRFYHVGDEQIDNFPAPGHLSRATYLRLFLPYILPVELERVLYLDCDLVVLKDLGGLYQNDLNGKALAAVKDVKAKAIIRIYFYPGLLSYFNAGVMLIDLKKWRNLNLLEKSVEFINNHKEELSTADQDVLNCLLKDDWLELDRVFNTDMKHQLMNGLPPKETVILHYSDKIKPWNYLYRGRNKKYYFKYLAHTPWADFQYQDKNIKNFFKRYIISINKEARNMLRPLAPSWLIDWNKKKFLSKLSINSKF